MRLDVSQQLRLEQQMKLAPRLIQAMEILQLPVMALQERIEAEIQSNPVLEMRYGDVTLEQPTPGEADGEDRGERQLVVDDRNGQAEDFQRLEQFQAEYGEDFSAIEAPPRPRRDSSDRDAKMDAMANAPAPEPSLNDYLLGQWAFVEADEDVKRVGAEIIGHLDEDGYLRTPLEDLDGECTQERLVALRQALSLVQQLDPPGVGARDLKECLTIQLLAERRAGRDVELELLLVQQFLRDIEMNHLPAVARKTGRTIEQVQAALANLSHLSPRPGSLVGGRNVPVISPDVIVEVDDDGQVTVRAAADRVPHVYVSRQYRRMARDRNVDRQARQFLRNNLRSAEWLIGAIHQRQQTVVRVAEEVFKAQREFLDAGAEALRPLPMADVAARVGVHVATVSRAVAGKYAQTPRGVFPLRMFFSGGKSTTEGSNVAWDAIRVKLREVVDGEDKSKPLNDDQIVEALKAAGIDIARRTVAKYRGLMDISPARKRRQY